MEPDLSPGAFKLMTWSETRQSPKQRAVTVYRLRTDLPASVHSPPMCFKTSSITPDQAKPTIRWLYGVTDRLVAGGKDGGGQVEWAGDGLISDPRCKNDTLYLQDQ